ncbi:GDCCVxC domain-containing (seleno)protein [Arthrobacter rhombi]|uniref:GDCCVxC domain-containing (seleno)protein n=1 Tax=Arthrobacter rhombi TaxID=71253 RepID=UPI0031DB49CF
MGIELTSVVTCPLCGRETSAQMSVDSCQYFWNCPECGERLQPLAGDCCVFCSYGTARCPSRQEPSE